MPLASRERRHCSLPRLGWPVRDNDDVRMADEDSPGRRNVAACPRRVTFSNTKAVDDPLHSCRQELWAVKHAPKSSVDLCVAPKKVKEALAWMSAASVSLFQSRSLHHGSNSSKLLILVGAPGIGKSTLVHCVAAELGLEVHEWTESYFSGGSGGHQHQLTPLNSLEQFLQHTGAGYQSLLSLEDARSSRRGKIQKKRPKPNGPLIVLDELPHLHGPEATARFRSILTAHVQSTTVPTVLIYSNAAEGKVHSSDLERLIEKQTLYSATTTTTTTRKLCEILQINAPTNTKFAKVIRSIAQAEGARINPNYAEELYFRCNGDLRFAISTMQFELIGSTSKFRASPLASTNTGPPSTKRHGIRDTPLMPFHALGKLLYAKRQKIDTRGPQDRPPLDFDPEQVVAQSEMDVSKVLYFLEYHCLEFFTDIDELTNALDHYSDAAVLLDHYKPGQALSNSADNAFPVSYVSSLVGRAVANANLHPAPFSFRSFGAPKVFDVIQKRNHNTGRIHKLSLDRTVTGSSTNAATFATYVLPFARTILPHHHVSSSTFLDSFFEAANRSHIGQENDENAAAEAALLKEHEEILMFDDIVEDNDNDEW